MPFPLDLEAPIAVFAVIGILALATRLRLAWGARQDLVRAERARVRLERIARDAGSRESPEAHDA